MEETRVYIDDRCIVKRDGKYALYLQMYNRETTAWNFVLVDEIYSIEEGISYNIDNITVTKEMLEDVLTDSEE